MLGIPTCSHLGRCTGSCRGCWCRCPRTFGVSMRVLQVPPALVLALVYVGAAPAVWLQPGEVPGPTTPPVPGGAVAPVGTPQVRALDKKIVRKIFVFAKLCH